MQTNENITTSRYKDASELGWTPDVRTIILSNYSDEQRHLNYIKDTIAARP